MKSIFCIIVVLFCSFFVKAKPDDGFHSELKTETTNSFVDGDKDMEAYIGCTDNVSNFLNEYSKVSDAKDYISAAQKLLQEDGLEGFACYAFSKFMETLSVNQNLNDLTSLQTEKIMEMSFENDLLTKDKYKLKQALVGMNQRIYGNNADVSAVKSQETKDFSEYMPKSKNSDDNRVLLEIRRYMANHINGLVEKLKANKDIASKLSNFVSMLDSKDPQGINKALNSMSIDDLNLLNSCLGTK